MDMRFYRGYVLARMFMHAVLLKIWSGSKPKVCNRPGAIRDIPHHIGYVTGRRLSQQTLPLALLFLVI